MTETAEPYYPIPPDEQKPEATWQDWSQEAWLSVRARNQEEAVAAIERALQLANPYLLAANAVIQTGPSAPELA